MSRPHSSPRPARAAVLAPNPMMSHPRATTEMILQAAYATSRSGRP